MKEAVEAGDLADPRVLCPFACLLGPFGPDPCLGTGSLLPFLLCPPPKWADPSLKPGLPTGPLPSLPKEVRMPEVLYEAVVEVDERLVLHQDGCQVFDSGQRVTGESCSQARRGGGGRRAGWSLWSADVDSSSPPPQA